MNKQYTISVKDLIDRETITKHIDRGILYELFKLGDYTTTILNQNKDE